MLVLGLPCLAAGILSFFIPETKNKELPQNMKDTHNNEKFDEILEKEMEPENEKTFVKTED